MENSVLFILETKVSSKRKIKKRTFKSILKNIGFTESHCIRGRAFLQIHFYKFYLYLLSYFCVEQYFLCCHIYTMVWVVSDLLLFFVYCETKDVSAKKFLLITTDKGKHISYILSSLWMRKELCLKICWLEKLSLITMGL